MEEQNHQKAASMYRKGIRTTQATRAERAGALHVHGHVVMLCHVTYKGDRGNRQSNQAFHTVEQGWEENADISKKDRGTKMDR